MWSIFENVPYAFERMCILLLWNERLYIYQLSPWSSILFNVTISLLIFCLEDLSIFDSGVLKSPTIIVFLSITFLKSSKIFFMYLGTLMLREYIFTMFVFLMDSSLEYSEVTFWVTLYGPFWGVYIVLYEYCYPGFFFFPVHFLRIFVSSPSLSVCVVFCSDMGLF